MIYELHFANIVLRGIFFKNDELGYHFITEEFNDDLIKFPKNCNLILKEDNIVELNFKTDFLYRSKKVKRNNKNIYVLSSKEVMNNLKYYTLNDLDSGNYLYNGDDVLEILGLVSSLVNGNYICSSVENYILAISELNEKYANLEHFYRGHYDYTYSLIPSLFRNKNYYENESNIYMDFKNHFYNILSSKKYIEILTMMQHYKMPTRLLDTTSNPLVALYMACDKPASYNKDNHQLGEVIMMNEKKSAVKYSDSNITTILSALAVLETPYKEELYDKIMESKEKNDPSIYKKCNAYTRYVAEVSQNIKFDDEFFNPDVLLKPRHVKVGMINERIIAQSGAFILYGLIDYKSGRGQLIDTQVKERIFILNRDYIRKQLNMLNINSAVLFPDMDHTAFEITKKYK